MEPLVTDLTQAELITHAGRCTELTCVYHGQYNAELRRRRLARWGHLEPKESDKK